MTYQGTIRDGLVVLDNPAALRDGTRVQVNIMPGPVLSPPPAFHPVGSWEGPSDELDRLLAEVQAMRDADLSLEKREN